LCRVRIAVCGEEEFPALGVPEEALKELGCGVRYEELGCSTVAVLHFRLPTPASDALLEVWECGVGERWVLQCAILDGRIHSCRCVVKWCGVAEEIIGEEVLLREGVYCFSDFLRRGRAVPS